MIYYISIWYILIYNILSYIFLCYVILYFIISSYIVLLFTVLYYVIRYDILFHEYIIMYCIIFGVCDDTAAPHVITETGAGCDETNRVNTRITYNWSSWARAYYIQSSTLL